LEKTLLDQVIQISKQAGQLLLDRQSEAQESAKLKKDGSPVTPADVLAENFILEQLGQVAPGIPILSEESPIPSYEERKDWKLFWLVDPLDGTKEYIKGRDDYTVNIALLENNIPVLAVIHAPGKNLTYFASKDGGSWKQVGEESPFRIYSERAQLDKELVIIESHSHGSSEQEFYLQSLKIQQRIKMGSSLKFCIVAEGSANLYPRFVPSMEWDVAAGDCIYRYSAASGQHTTGLQYNKENLLNGSFIIGI